FVLEYVGEQWLAADDLDSGAAQTPQRLEAGAADEHHSCEIEDNMPSRSNRLLAFLFEQLGRLQQDVSLEYQDYPARVPIFVAETKNGHPKRHPWCHDVFGAPAPEKDSRTRCCRAAMTNRLTRRAPRAPTGRRNVSAAGRRRNSITEHPVDSNAQRAAGY